MAQSETGYPVAERYRSPRSAARARITGTLRMLSSTRHRQASPDSARSNRKEENSASVPPHLPRHQLRREYGRKAPSGRTPDSWGGVVVGNDERPVEDARPVAEVRYLANGKNQGDRPEGDQRNHVDGRLRLVVRPLRVARPVGTTPLGVLWAGRIDGQVAQCGTFSAAALVSRANMHPNR